MGLSSGVQTKVGPVCCIGPYIPACNVGSVMEYVVWGEWEYVRPSWISHVLTTPCNCNERLNVMAKIMSYTPQTQQRLFFSICDHSSSSFAIENNWVRPHPPERSSKIGIWIEKFRCQNSNLNLPTIKNGFYGYSYLKDLLRIMKRIWAQFWNRWVIPVT